jgi:O-antigen/teichoic acid export membrane protein
VAEREVGIADQAKRGCPVTAGAATAAKSVSTGAAPPATVGPRTLRTARAIVLLTVCEVVGKLGTLVIVVGAARTLPLGDFGIFAVALGVGALAAVIPSWGFDNLLVQRGAVEPAVLPKLLAELVVLRCALTAAVLAAAGAVAVAAGVRGQVLLAAGCVVLACLAETVADAFRAVAVACEAPTVVATAQLIQRGTTAVLVLAALLVVPSLIAVSLAYLAGTAIGVLVTALGTARLGIRPQWSYLRWTGIAQFSRASRSGGLHVVASMALFRIDTVLLAALAGAAAAGRYAAAYRLLETVIFVAWTVARSVFPIMASSPQTWRVRRGAERGLVVLASVFLPYMALLWCRGADVMRVLYGDSLPIGDVVVLAWLAPAPLLFGAGYLAAYVLMADGPNARVLLGSVGALIINVALNLVLIPGYGPVGAAAATSVSYAVQVALLYPAAGRRAGRPALLRPLLPAAVASAAAGGVLLLVAPFWPALLLAAVVYLVVGLWLAARLDPEQVGVIRGLLGQRRLRRLRRLLAGRLSGRRAEEQRVVRRG